MLLIFILIVYGLTNTIVNEHIMKKITNKIKGINKFFFNLFSCETCLSFWIGMFISLFINLDIHSCFLLNIFFHGLLSTGAINLIEWIKIKFNYE
jgi:hypothetical protein